MKNTRLESHSTKQHEPAVPIHDVFSVAIPNAFGVSFLKKLLELNDARKKNKK